MKQQICFGNHSFSRRTNYLFGETRKIFQQEAVLPPSESVDLEKLEKELQERVDREYDIETSEGLTNLQKTVHMLREFVGKKGFHTITGPDRYVYRSSRSGEIDYALLCEGIRNGTLPVSMNTTKGFISFDDTGKLISFSVNKIIFRTWPPKIIPSYTFDNGDFQKYKQDIGDDSPLKFRLHIHYFTNEPEPDSPHE